VSYTTNAGMTLEALTLGFASRATQCKRPILLFTDPERLSALAHTRGPLQVVFAGKAHPQDLPGKELVQQIHRLGTSLRGAVTIAYLENYDMGLGRLLTAGSDVWLNTPQRPLEASGTSGMKAALNGVPSLSTLDGWWIEGGIEGLTGWTIGRDDSITDADSADEAADLYDKLERVVIPLLNNDCDGLIQVMRHSVALNASSFNTERMLDQYVTKAYSAVRRAPRSSATQ